MLSDMLGKVVGRASDGWVCRVIGKAGTTHKPGLDSQVRVRHRARQTQLDRIQLQGCWLGTSSYCFAHHGALGAAEHDAVGVLQVPDL